MPLGRRTKRHGLAGYAGGWFLTESQAGFPFWRCALAEQLSLAHLQAEADFRRASPAAIVIIEAAAACPGGVVSMACRFCREGGASPVLPVWPSREVAWLRWRPSEPGSPPPASLVARRHFALLLGRLCRRRS